ncbi:MAG: DUF192 domain-containing protein [Pseudomonadota bacterium]
MRSFLLLLLLAAGAAAQELPPLDESFDQGVLVIVANRACHRFDIYLAVDTAQQRRGLMFVRELPPRSGMLFVYAKPAHLSMWMKNTFIPLDMLFVRDDGVVASVETDTEPQSLRSVSAKEPVNYVLELNAGITRELGIGPGNRLLLDPRE